MREIKFRAWHTRGVSKDEFAMTYWVLGSGLDNSVFFSNAKDVMQFTGLKDKNGKEIYEGDILQTNEAGWKAKVIFNHGAFLLVDNRGGFSTEPEWKECEVIGNIHENPELVQP